MEELEAVNYYGARWNGSPSGTPLSPHQKVCTALALSRVTLLIPWRNCHDFILWSSRMTLTPGHHFLPPSHTPETLSFISDYLNPNPGLDLPTTGAFTRPYFPPPISIASAGYTSQVSFAPPFGNFIAIPPPIDSLPVTAGFTYLSSSNPNPPSRLY